MDKIPSSHKFHTSPAANPTSPAAASSPEQPAVWDWIRPAYKQDVPVIHRLVCQLTGFLRLNHVFSATEFSLSSALFPTPSPPSFLSLTTLLLEVSSSPIPQRDPEDEKEGEKNPGPVTPVVRRIELAAPMADMEAEAFASPRGRGLVAAGFTLCFPKYSAFRAKPGLYVEGLFVREAWLRRGLGQMLLSAVAAQAARMGLPKVEWDVVNWNAGAVGFFYSSMWGWARWSSATGGTSNLAGRLWRHMGQRKVEAAGTTRACAGFDQA